MKRQRRNGHKPVTQPRKDGPGYHVLLLFTAVVTGAMGESRAALTLVLVVAAQLLARWRQG